MNVPTYLQPLTRFFLLLKPDNKEIRNVYLFAILSGLLGLILPLGIQAIINFIQTGQVTASWFVLVFAVVAAIAVSGMLNIFQMRITENLQQRIFVKAAFDFADRIPKVKMEELLKRYAPELTNRFFDTLTIQKGISKLLVDLTSAILQILFGLILLSFYHSFFIFFGFGLLLLLFFIFKYTSQKGLKTSMDESKIKYKIAHWLEEMAHSRLSFKMAGNPHYSLKRTDKYLDDYIKSRDAHFGVLMRQYAYLIGFKVLIALALLLIGGLLVINQTMNIGQFVAAEIIILLILSSVEKLILSLEVAYDVLTAIEKIGEVTDLELERTDGVSLGKKAAFTIEAQELVFKSDLYQRPVLNDFSIKINAGEKVVFISDSSVSIQVFFAMLGGIYQDYEGVISINKVALNSINLTALRDEIGNCLYFDKFIPGTIEENISLGRTYVPFEEVQRVAALIGLDDDLHYFPNGLQTVITPDAHFLPKHVIRKILLCRSLAGNPGLLLLEEPIYGLKDKQIDQVLGVLKNLPDSTLLISTERKEILNLVERVIYIEKGKVVLDGTPDEYIKNYLSC